MNDMMFIVLFINKTNKYENDAYFQPITSTPKKKLVYFRLLTVIMKCVPCVCRFTRMLTLIDIVKF